MDSVCSALLADEIRKMAIERSSSMNPEAHMTRDGLMIVMVGLNFTQEANLDLDPSRRVFPCGPDGNVSTHKVEYEWKPLICMKCKSFGHVDASCSNKQAWIATNMLVGNAFAIQLGASSILAPLVDPPVELDGAWTVVSCKRSKDGSPSARSFAPIDLSPSSSFGGMESMVNPSNRPPTLHYDKGNGQSQENSIQNPNQGALEEKGSKEKIDKDDAMIDTQNLEVQPSSSSQDEGVPQVNVPMEVSERENQFEDLDEIEEGAQLPMQGRPTRVIRRPERLRNYVDLESFRALIAMSEEPYSFQQAIERSDVYSLEHMQLHSYWLYNVPWGMYRTLTYRKEHYGNPTLILSQKIVMKVQMNSDKTRSKALKFAAVAYGVSSVAIEGEDKDQVVVIGDGVDSVVLTRLLRKKVGYASLLSVEEVKENKEQEDEAESPTPWTSNFSPYPHFQVYDMAYAPTPSNCSIM
ncbi:hypothetical protein HHK36_006820 [Tetracentron sinense]|uniref:HMA domain-containing protein n=1 Tax=Tetracentron sinense TaxID=13715 RepID=A0A834ZLC2_TETSI|nr:hypothetical protein HHK36_006820 [Tetracentron sinense]